MSIAFRHKEAFNGDDLLTVKTNHHVTVDFSFDGDQATLVYLDGEEFPMTLDMLSGLFVCIDTQFIDLVSLSRQANDAYPEIMAELAKAAREADENERYLSSPSRTGRI